MTGKDVLRMQLDGSLNLVQARLEGLQAGRPDYLEPPVWAEVSDLDGLPAWQFLARPAISHIRVHAGEFDVLLKVLRSEAAARAARTPA